MRTPPRSIAFPAGMTACIHAIALTMIISSCSSDKQSASKTYAPPMQLDMPVMPEEAEAQHAGAVAYAPGVVAAPSPSNAIIIDQNGVQIYGKRPEQQTTVYRYQPSLRDPIAIPKEDRERYDGEPVSDVKLARLEPVSTFSVDVDTGSYSNTRRFLTAGRLPPEAAVRTEEMVNYFRYDYPKPASRDVPFSVSSEVAQSPWNNQSRLLRIGIRGYDLDHKTRPAANLVFLLDVSGSMQQSDKLPLVKTALGMLANKLSARDKVSIVVYAGAAGIVLEPTSNSREIKEALARLDAGGSTAGGAGIKLAYKTARDHFVKGGVNRVILATDGDFNVGITSQDDMIKLIEKNRESGITLTTLGFGQNNYNEAMMEQIADVGNGNYAYIDNAMEARKVLDEEMTSTLFTIAKDVKIQIEFNPAVISQYRLIGYENRALREEDFDNDRIDAGDIGAGHQVTAIYEVIPAGKSGWIGDRRYWKTKAGAAVKGEEMAYLKLRYKSPDGAKSKLIAQTISSASLNNAPQPKGDLAFAVAVAAFGQKLRGDSKLADYSFDQVARLAGSPKGYWRQEFVKLTQLAAGHDDS